MDLLARLLGHDYWTTAQLLERYRELRAEQKKTATTAIVCGCLAGHMTCVDAKATRLTRRSERRLPWHKRATGKE